MHPRFTQRTALRFLLLLLVLVPGLACGGRTEGETAPVRVAYAPVVLDLPFFLGKDTGLFERKGVTIDARVFTSANDMVNALVADQVDVVTGVSLVPVLNLEAQFPGRVRILFHSKMTASSAYDGIVVRSDSSLKNLSDLKGHKIAVYPGTTATNLLRAFLGDRGIQPKEVEIIALPPASHLNALSSGTVDALMAYEPTLTAAVIEQNARRLFGSIYVEMQNPSPISVTIVSRRFERSNPALVAALSEGFQEAILQVRADPDGSRAHLAGYTRLSPDVVKGVALIPDTTPAEVDIASLQSFASLMQRIGELPKPVDVGPMVGPAK